MYILIECNKFGYDGYLFLSNLLHIKHPNPKLTLRMYNVVSELDMYDNEWLHTIANMALVSISIGKCKMHTKLTQVYLNNDIGVNVQRIIRSRF